MNHENIKCETERRDHKHEIVNVKEFLYSSSVTLKKYPRLSFPRTFHHQQQRSRRLCLNFVHRSDDYGLLVGIGVHWVVNSSLRVIQFIQER